MRADIPSRRYLIARLDGDCLEKVLGHADFDTVLPRVSLRIHALSKAPSSRLLLDLLPSLSGDGWIEDVASSRQMFWRLEGGALTGGVSDWWWEDGFLWWLKLDIFLPLL